MKATGILRRIDELGRVVIPKEIRKTMKMREGEELEIYTTAEEVVLKKYSELSAMETFARSLVTAIKKVTGRSAAVTDGDVVIASVGTMAPPVGSAIGDDLRKILAGRRTVVLSEEKCLPLGEKGARGEVIRPILSAGDLFGALILASDEPLTKADETVAAMGASLFEQQIDR
ncbi:MAG: AbrB/MazE/SpoVT family DNA-binding domain-containing protein [Clostridia bacterium]|nr:AbrB/MazE/SpoVT family DNA-binding domain-containing protein [Clostridia bacterium]